ncbi:DNA polymerase/3'-5' exonuclease PolX [Alienimonas californiensis]|uniref:DNA-directed DNA polymerase n=1 Tax=Alienimonas californiensis TaxID=2527989 RepID=A0A517PFH7_9PLAN|nr:DNA polymerase/3'-5' exonuclease PolX [Alienimonas californiensis]QDT18115.1 DNA polymerase/3'-5' exonuclease PolX [Alienimonas californiensis]
MTDGSANAADGSPPPPPAGEAPGNGTIAARLTELADLLEIADANPFRVRAYRSAARTFKGLAEPAAALLAAGRPLTELQGVGKDLAANVATLLESGTFPSLEEARDAVPPGVRTMLRLPGLGPKKVGAIYRDLGVKTLEGLEAAIADGSLAGLPGFGKKTGEKVLANLALVREGIARSLLARSLPIAESLADAVRAAPGTTACEPVGSVRRRAESVGDVDLSAASTDPDAAVEAFCTHPLVAETLSRTHRTARVRLTVDPGRPTEAELVVNAPEAWGAGLILGTGSKTHVAALRDWLSPAGLTLTDAGLIRDGVLIDSATEAAVYAAAGVAFVPPELREGGNGVLRVADLEQGGGLPTLVELGDLRGDLHMHTTASDGAGTIREMAAAAKARGLKYIAITDHSQRVTMANGLNAERLRAHWRAIDAANVLTPGVRILKGIECDILEDATLDLPDDVLADADWVVAVLHYGLSQPRDQIMKRLTTALESPHVDCIGHPSGRLIGKRPGADINWEAFLDRAAATGTLLEINAAPERLDLSAEHAREAANRGIPIVINTDAHAPGAVGAATWGVYQARRAGLTAEQVANTRDWPGLKALLK